MSSPATVEVKVSELETMVKALVMNSFGYPEKHAQVMTDVLMYAQLRHNSQVLYGIKDLFNEAYWNFGIACYTDGLFSFFLPKTREQLSLLQQGSRGAPRMNPLRWNTRRSCQQGSMGTRFVLKADRTISMIFESCNPNAFLLLSFPFKKKS